MPPFMHRLYTPTTTRSQRAAFQAGLEDEVYPFILYYATQFLP
jgi:hypothetical protein